MLILQVFLAGLVLVSYLLPDLPFSKAWTGAVLKGLSWTGRQVTLAKALIGISMALLLFSAIWVLQGDAPLILAAMLPELAAWFTTFEIATLVDAMLGVGGAMLAARTAGWANFVRNMVRPRQRRSRKSAAARKAANDDDHPAIRLIAA